MKRQLIAIGLVSFLAVPSVVFAEEDACAPIMSEGMTEEAVMEAKSAAMNTSECRGQRLGSVEEFTHGHGVSIYGSFRTGLIFGSGDTEVSDLSSRWGIQGSAEVSEGLTAGFRYESGLNSANAEFAGGKGHTHEEVEAATDDVDGEDVPRNTSVDHGHAETDADGGVGGRLSYVDLSGGFGTIRLGQIWSASGNHYYFKIDPSHWNGKAGGSGTRNANSVSYSSSAGDVSFQIDKVTGDKERTEFGATADLGPVGVGVGYWKSGVDDDQSSFTGVALSAGAAGVNLTVGLGSNDDENGKDSDTSVLSITGAVGDSGLSYGVQITNSDAAGGQGDQNLIALTSSLGSGASLIFEFADPDGVDADGEDLDSTSLIGLRVDF